MDAVSRLNFKLMFHQYDTQLLEITKKMNCITLNNYV